MTYHILQKTYRINPDGTQELREERTYTYKDTTGTALSEAENKFYAALTEELYAEQELGHIRTDDEPDMLNVQEWYLDSDHKLLALQIMISESQLIRNLAVGNNSMSPIDTELKNTVLLGEAIVPNQYIDVSTTRERLYRNRDGIYILETSMRTSAPNIKWESQCHAVSVALAQEWCKLHLNRIQYKDIFGDIQINDDKVPMSIMIRKDYREALQRLAKTTGRQEQSIIEEALGVYLNQSV